MESGNHGSVSHLRYVFVCLCFTPRTYIGLFLLHVAGRPVIDFCCQPTTGLSTTCETGREGA